jgi:4-amino-4-deoxy-L-arabinose transferase-like glycosyltransferase
MDIPSFGPKIAKRVLLLTVLALLIAVSACNLFYQLGTEPFQDYDEATYAEVTAESLSHGNYLSLTFLNQPYFRKPPLMFWMTAAGEKVFADDEFAMRLPSALAALLLVPLAFLICLEAGAGIGTGLLAATIVATTSALMEPARQARFDVLVSFFIVAAFYAGIRAQRSSRWYVSMGVFVGLAVLTKSVIAVFAPVALLIYLFQLKRLSFLKEKWFWGGVAAFLAVVAPWHLYMTLTSGVAFWHIYLGTQVIDRAGSNLFDGISSNLTTNLDYIGFFLRFGMPWSPLFLVSLLGTPLSLRRMGKAVCMTWVSCAGTVIAIVGVMFWSQTKAVTYLIPLYPFMAIALAISISSLWKRSSENVRSLIEGVGAFCAIVALYLCIWNVHHLNPYYRVQYQLAREEYAITQAINARSSDPRIYTYKNDYLGSLEYYARIPFTTGQFIYMLESAPNDIIPGFVVAPSSLEELQRQFPQFTFSQIYAGSLLSAFTVAR